MGVYIQMDDILYHWDIADKAINFRYFGPTLHFISESSMPKCKANHIFYTAELASAPTDEQSEEQLAAGVILLNNIEKGL